MFVAPVRRAGEKKIWLGKSISNQNTHTHRRLRAKESVNKTIAREKTKTRLEESVNQRVTVVFNFETTVQDLRCLLPALPDQRCNRVTAAGGTRAAKQRKATNKKNHLEIKINKAQPSRFAFCYG